MKSLMCLVSSGLFLTLSLSCSTTHCKDKASDGQKNTGSVATSTALPATGAGAKLMTKVKIYKADGTLQCNQGKKIELDVMAKELFGLQIYSSENLHDGLMRIQMCGKPTGQNNVYEINASDLPKALSLGFKKWVRSE